MTQTPDQKDFAPQTTEVKGSPQRNPLYGERKVGNDEVVPQAVGVNIAGQLKVLPLAPRIEAVGRGQAKAAGVLIFTAKVALTDVKIVVVNTTAVQSKFTLNLCWQGEAAAAINRLSYLYPIEMGDKWMIDGLGMEVGDVIRCLCTADNDMSVHVFAKRWQP